MSTDASPHIRAILRATLVLPAPMKPTKNTVRESVQAMRGAAISATPSTGAACRI